MRVCSPRCDHVTISSSQNRHKSRSSIWTLILIWLTLASKSASKNSFMIFMNVKRRISGAVNRWILNYDPGLGYIIGSGNDNLILRVNSLKQKFFEDQNELFSEAKAASSSAESEIASVDNCHLLRDTSVSSMTEFSASYLSENEYRNILEPRNDPPTPPIFYQMLFRFICVHWSTAKVRFRHGFDARPNRFIPQVARGRVGQVTDQADWSPS